MFSPFFYVFNFPFIDRIFAVEISCMKTSVADIRKDYKKASLRSKDLSNNPFDLFGKWFDQAASKDRRWEQNIACSPCDNTL